MNDKKDVCGNTYEHYKGKVWISKGREFGNVAVFIPNYKNNGLYVIYYGKLDKEHIENAIICNGWKLEDWL